MVHLVRELAGEAVHSVSEGGVELPVSLRGVVLLA